MMKYIILATVTAAVITAFATHTHSQTVTATGTATTLENARTNASVAAHFQCNRKGLWADLTTLEEVSVEISKRPMSGGRVKLKFYDVDVKSECGPDYIKSVPTEQQQ